jgi:D-hexose-6-phosphate mutarotase
MNIEDLNSQYAIRGVAEFMEGSGDLTRLVMAAEGAVAEVYLLGGHVTSFRPAGGADVLWLSRASSYEVGKPIRGGIPICHPWFGPLESDPSAPMHGYVRTTELGVVSIALTDDGGVTAVLGKRFDRPAGRDWPGDFELTVRVTVGRSLSVAVRTSNIGGADLVISEALHSYFRVSDVRSVNVTGLAGDDYYCKLTGETARQGPEPLTFAAQTDRIYKGSTGEMVLHDPGMGRAIRVAKRHSRSTVVWNPWIEKAAAMADFGDDEWPGMLCIETANAMEDAVTIAPGEMHEIETIISVE